MPFSKDLTGAPIRVPAAPGTHVPREVERLRELIADHFASAGVLLGEDRLRDMADDVLVDAIRVALLWLEGTPVVSAPASMRRG